MKVGSLVKYNGHICIVITSNNHTYPVVYNSVKLHTNMYGGFVLAGWIADNNLELINEGR